ncbi:uncharacterized protein LOC113642371 isoform X2 [Tachysurus fulvidraco]|uniref:uncharacterized protein LOC113642371 isoform X2 n=1 Tax=Tachysurus fulvidraco TaxID=1234273 RepID=UPI001FEFA9FF|nr:uncharacterized protein LOC113642371 isoform X2 [Tachysurus fulvidraco]
MWRYKQPGFALRLLSELQKQQQCSLHCDVILQTEGVSIPAHSCMLSALSPVFYRAFANVPLLPVGQSRLVELEAIRAHALIKLVGFMYSGEMEGESLDEQQEVIDVACRLGFGNIMEGKEKQVNRHQNKTASWRELGLQTEETEGRKKDASVQSLFKKPNFTHSGTQTDSTETHFVDNCVASESELSIDLSDELTDVASEYNSISPDTGLAWIDEIVAHSSPKSTEALVRVHAKRHQTQKEKKRAKYSKKEDAHISLKIKLKRQKSGALWEIVSIQEENTGDGSKTCGSSDDPPMTHSLAKTSAEEQLSPSPLVTCQNLETVTLTPPLEMTTPLPSTPIRPPSETFCPIARDPSPFSSTSQMPPLSVDVSQPQESDEHIGKLLDMITVGLNILPSITMEGNSSMPAHLDQKLEKYAAVANSPASYPCLLGHNLEAVGSRTTSGTSEQREAGSEDLSVCRKWTLKNQTLLSNTSPCMPEKKNIDSSFTKPCTMTDIVTPKLIFGNEGLEHQNVVEMKSDTYAWSRKQTFRGTNEDCDIQTQISRTAICNAALDHSIPIEGQCPEQIHITDQVSLWQSSDVDQAPNSDNWADFSEMRLPRCLSPLASEAGETTGISTQNLIRPLEFSSCLSASHINLQPTLRCMSSSVQPQAPPGNTNQQNSSCTPQNVNEIHSSGVGKNLCPLKSYRDHNGVAIESNPEEKKTKMADLKNNLRKGTEDITPDRQTNESVDRGISTAMHNVESDNEPTRKKAKVAGYPNEVCTQAGKVVDPCSAKIKNIRRIENKKDISNPVISEKIDWPNAAKTRNTVSIDQKSQANMTHGVVSSLFKCKGQEACQKDVWDTKQPTSLKRGLGMSIQKRKCTKAQMEDLSKISELNSSPPVLNDSSSCSQHDSQLTQMRNECVARQGFKDSVKDLINECEKNNEPEMKNPFIEPEKVSPDVNLNREGDKQPQRLASLAKKASFCDKIFHQTVFRLDTTVTKHFLPINHQRRSYFQTFDRKIRTSLPPSVICKKIREPPESDHMSAELMLDSNKWKIKDTIEESGREKCVPRTDKSDEVLDKSKVDPKNKAVSEQVESGSKNVNGCFVNRNPVREAEINLNTGLSIHEAVEVNAASRLYPIPTVRDFNNNFDTENHLQLESTTTLLHQIRPETMMEKPKIDEQITESLSELAVSYKPTDEKTKELHPKLTGCTRTGNLEGQEGEKEETTIRKAEHVEVSRMKDSEAKLSDIEVDVLDERVQLAIGHGDEVFATSGSIRDTDEEESQISTMRLNDGQVLAIEEELNGQQVLRTEVMSSDEATHDMTSEMLNTEASSIPREEGPDLSSFSVDPLGSSAAFLPDLNTESAEDYGSAEEELIVDDISDSSPQLCSVVGTVCNIIQEEGDELRDEEEEDVDVTGEESN